MYIDMYVTEDLNTCIGNLAALSRETRTTQDTIRHDWRIGSWTDIVKDTQNCKSTII